MRANLNRGRMQTEHMTGRSFRPGDAEPEEMEHTAGNKHDNKYNHLDNIIITQSIKKPFPRPSRFPPWTGNDFAPGGMDRSAGPSSSRRILPGTSFRRSSDEGKRTQTQGPEKETSKKKPVFYPYSVFRA